MYVSVCVNIIYIYIYLFIYLFIYSFNRSSRQSSGCQWSQVNGDFKLFVNIAAARLSRRQGTRRPEAQRAAVLHRIPEPYLESQFTIIWGNCFPLFLSFKVVYIYGQLGFPGKP